MEGLPEVLASLGPWPSPLPRPSGATEDIRSRRPGARKSPMLPLGLCLDPGAWGGGQVHGP